MSTSEPSPGGRMLGYAISGLTTLLWVGTVLPSGPLAIDANGDLAAPLHRQAWLLVPALVLLVVGPAGFVLSRTRVGLLAVLSATDAFIALYAALLLSVWGALQGTTSLVLVLVLYGMGGLSIFETVRVLQTGPEEPSSSRWRGLRLALCILVLLTPSILLVQDGRELASLLGPYLLLAISTGGAALARTCDGLRLTAATLQLALALLVVITLRYTLFEADSTRQPAFAAVGPIGWATMGLAFGILLLTTAQALRFGRLVRPDRVLAAAVDGSS